LNTFAADKKVLKMAIRFLHTPKNKEFKFKPRYYNEEKEELEKRIKKIKQEMGVEDDDTTKSYTPHIKGQMRGYFRKNIEQKRKSSVRLIVILVVLFALVYFLLYY
jgi:hypothetical protein